MTKKKNDKLYNVILPTSEKEKLPITIPQYNNIVIGMTFIRLNGKYGLDDFCSLHRKISDRDIYDEFYAFKNTARKYTEMLEFLKAFSPKNGQPKKSDFQEEEAKRLKVQYDIDVDIHHIKHVHARPHGNGETVIWGYTYDNIFEILAIDPKHDSI